MLENVQIIKENSIPKFAVLDYKEYIEIKELLSDEEKIQDYLDYLHIQNVKKMRKQTYSLDEVKNELKIVDGVVCRA